MVGTIVRIPMLRHVAATTEREYQEPVDLGAASDIYSAARCRLPATPTNCPTSVSKRPRIAEPIRDRDSEPTTPRAMHGPAAHTDRWTRNSPLHCR
jgi:hypothetical protein